MNVFFFGFTTNIYEISIITLNFTNYKYLGSNINVCCGFKKKNKWVFEIVKNIKNDNFFVVVVLSDVTNSNIFNSVKFQNTFNYLFIK